MRDRQDRLQEQYAHLAAEYVKAESNRTSLITVTRALVSDDLARATVFVTVLPEEREHGAVDFLNRSRDEFRAFIARKTKSRRLPNFTFAIDLGEKHRRHLDTIDLS
jgi:ribosome-binding factor A